MSSGIKLTPRGVTRRQFAGGLAALLAGASATPSHASIKQIRLGVFSLFQSQEMSLKADRAFLLSVDDRRFALSPDDSPALIRREGEWLGELSTHRPGQPGAWRHSTRISRRLRSPGRRWLSAAGRFHGYRHGGCLHPRRGEPGRPAASLPHGPGTWLRGLFWLPRTRGTPALTSAIRRTASFCVDPLLPARRRRLPPPAPPDCVSITRAFLWPPCIAGVAREELAPSMNLVYLSAIIPTIRWIASSACIIRRPGNANWIKPIYPRASGSGSPSAESTDGP
jgi:hypothetical protein